MSNHNNDPNDREDFNSPSYRAWKFAVMSRDDFTCQLTGSKKGPFEVHHIIPWSVAPKLRHVVSNGITLTKEAHVTVTGREKEYEEMFKRIVNEKQTQIKKDRKIGISKRGKWYPRNPRQRYG